MNEKKVVLIGFPGVGKSSVGALLERIYGWSWLDLDVEIERRSGRTVTSIIREEGETNFRALESQTLAEVISGKYRVISLGGGALLSKENRDLLLEKSIMVQLEASLDEVTNRLLSDEKNRQEKGAEPLRPLLVSEPTSEEALRSNIAALVEKRRGLYDSAHARVSTQGLSPELVAGEVFQVVEQMQKEQNKR